MILTTVQDQLTKGTNMARRTVIARKDGRSTTGNLHGLLIEADDNPGFSRVTITGADGVKRHATVVMANADLRDLFATIPNA